VNALQVWSSLEIAKLIASLATPIAVALMGFWISRTLNASDQKRQEKLQAARRERDDKRQAEKEERYRRNAPHIELELDCQFHGIRDDHYLATFTVSATNAGYVWHKFEQINLRVRGIKNEPFEYFSRRGLEEEDNSARRVAFPYELLHTNLVPWNFVFIEPRVTQHLTLTTTVSNDYSYLLAHVVFEYKEYWPHTAEAVFKVPAAHDHSSDVRDSRRTDSAL
jgi:hypothetical protein